jgi:hypothetical protein
MTEIDTDTPSVPVEPLEVTITNWSQKPENVRVLGSPRGVMKSYSFTAADGAIQLCGKDRRRTRVILMFQLITGGSNSSVFFGTREDVQASIQLGVISGAASWPVRPPGSAPGSPVEMAHTDEVYAGLSADNTGTCIATVITERWD